MGDLLNAYSQPQVHGGFVAHRDKHSLLKPYSLKIRGVNISRFSQILTLKTNFHG